MNERVLVVDDDKLMLYGMLKNRKRHGLNIVTALGGWEALEMMRLAEYAVIISDFDMPGMDGRDFLRRCRDRSPTTVRIMLSGACDGEFITEMLSEGLVFAFIRKPFNPLQITPYVLKALAEHRRLVEGSVNVGP